MEETKADDVSRVYHAEDVMRALRISRSSTYIFLKEVFVNKQPFEVIKIGKRFLVPKQSFDAWLPGAPIKGDDVK